MLYAVAEREAMRSFQTYKDRLFYPACRFLTARGISANHVSVLSGLAAAVGLLIAYSRNAPEFFFIGLWAHVILDGLDGALARYQKAGPTGVLVDTAADMTGIASASIYATAIADIPASMSTPFFLSYTALVGISLLRDRLGFPYTFTVRPRFFVYFFLTVDFLLRGETAGLIMVASTIPMTILVVVGMYQLLRRQSRAAK